MIEILSTDVSDDAAVTTENNIEDNTIESKLISIMLSIVEQCSNKIFQVCIYIAMQDRAYRAEFDSGRVGLRQARVGSGRVGSWQTRVGSGQKILTDFEFYTIQIVGLDEIMILLL
jgi:hypothetical protein